MIRRQVSGVLRAVVLAGVVAGVVILGALGRAAAAPYADMVIDARTGEVLRATNADSRLHPASLTKMMTLYVAFEAIRLGEISLDTVVTISPQAAAEPPSKLGLRAGQRIQLRYLIRAAAVKSANDAATAIGEAISGSEAAFARRMNRTALALGMTRSTFKNANGLTEAGHLSTARDMTTLGRRLFYDYPQYYNLFSRRSADAGGTAVANTNRRFLDAYRGADGIKTGYTRAAGFNLVASAERGQERIIATVFGGESTANRNARMAELLDLGFSRAPSRATVNRPALPRYDDQPAEPPAAVLLAEGARLPEGQLAGKIVRVSGAVSRSPRPQLRGGGASAEPPAALLAAIETDIAAAIASVASEAAVREVASAEAAMVAAEDAAEAVMMAANQSGAEASPAPLAAIAAPPPRPAGLGGAEAAEPPVAIAAAEGAEGTPLPDATAMAEAEAEAEAPALVLSPEILLAAAGLDTAGVDAEEALSLVASAAPAPVAADLPGLAEPGHETALALDPEPASMRFAAAEPPMPAVPEPVLRPEPVSAEVVTRLSTSGGRYSGITIGRYPSRFEAEKALLSTAMSDFSGLGQALRRVVQRGGGFDATFMGLDEAAADRACRRIAARGLSCATIGG